MIIDLYVRLEKYFKFTKEILSFRILSILLLGFSAGIPLALTGSTLSMWLARVGIDVKTIGLFSLVVIPFSFKYLWSPIFDNIAIPYFSRRFGFRKSWLILSQVFLMIAIVVLGASSPLKNITLTAAAALLVSFFSASQDILIDALRIEMLEKKEQALGASMYVYGYRVAMIVSGAGSLLLADYMSWSKVFMIMSLCIMVGIIVTLFIKEPEYSSKHLANATKFGNIIKYAVKSCFTKECLLVVIYFATLISLLNYLQVSSGTKVFIGLSLTALAIHFMKDKIKFLIPDSILDFCTRPQWIYILLFVIFYKFSDTLLDSLKSKLYVDTGFSNSEIAYIAKGLGLSMTMVGLFVGGIIYYRLKTFKSLLVAGVLQILSNLIFIWVAKDYHNLFALSVAVSIENFIGALNTVVVVAYLSSLCNINYTATQYALLSSLSSVGRSIMVAPGGYLVDQFGWINFIWITVIVGIPSIIILFILRKSITASES